MEHKGKLKVSMKTKQVLNKPKEEVKKEVEKTKEKAGE